MASKAGKKGMNPTLKKVFIGIGITGLVLILGSMALKLNKLDKTNEVSATFGYEQGLIGADGGEVKGTTSIRTKDLITVDGLKCDLAEDASITYQLFWYDEEEVFISASEELTLDFDASTGTVPETAEYVRIMITPVNDPEVSITEIAGYAGELTVEYKR